MSTHQSVTMADHYRVGTTMQIAGSPTSSAMQEIGAYGASQAPSSPVNTGQRKRTYKPAQKYNRSTVKWEDYLLRDEDKITAKEFRVLIPQMFQHTRFPRREVNKTKVKGLWEKGAKPADWPRGVEFRDPNNVPKFQLKESKVVFCYLKRRIQSGSHTQPPYNQAHPHTYEDSKENIQAVKQEPLSPVLRGPLQYGGVPDLPAFRDVGGARGAHNPGHGGPHTPGLPVMATSISVVSPRMVPATVTDMDEVAMTQVAMTQVAMQSGVQLHETVDYSSDTKPGTLVTSTHATDILIGYDNGQSLLSKPQAVPVETQPEYLDTKPTNLTPLDNAFITPTNQVISVVQEAEHEAGQPITESAMLTEAQQPVTESMTLVEDEECVRFAREVEEGLVDTVAKFGKKFEHNDQVMTQLELVIKDTYKPLFDLAKMSRSTCAELSKLAGQLKEMLGRFSSFIYSDTEVSEILSEMATLQAAFTYQEVVICTDVPAVDHEVMVMNARCDVTPTLQQEPRDHFIPTIADLQARARQKAAELEAPTVPQDPMVPQDPQSTLGGWRDEKVRVESVLSPSVCRDLEGMQLGDEQPEELGVQLKDDGTGDQKISSEDFDSLMKSLNFLNTGDYESFGIAARQCVEPETDEASSGTETDTLEEVPNVQATSPGSQQPAQTSQHTSEAMMGNNDPMPQSTAELENEAVRQLTAAAYNRYDGAMALTEPPTTKTASVIEDVTEDEILENVLNLETDWPYDLLGTHHITSTGQGLVSDVENFDQGLVSDAENFDSFLGTPIVPIMTDQMMEELIDTQMESVPIASRQMRPGPTVAQPSVSAATMPQTTHLATVPRVTTPQATTSMSTVPMPTVAQAMVPVPTLAHPMVPPAKTSQPMDLDKVMRKLQEMQNGAAPMIPTTVTDIAERNDAYEEPPQKKSRKRMTAANKHEPYKGGRRESTHHDHGKGRYGKGGYGKGM